MAKTYYRRTYTYRRRRYFRRKVNYLMRNYGKEKIAMQYTLQVNTSAMGFRMSESDVRTNLNLEVILNNSDEYIELSKKWTAFKVTGILIETAPIKTDPQLRTIYPCYLAYITSTDDPTDINALLTAQKSMLMDMNSNQRRYWSLKAGGIDTWNDTQLNADFPGKLCFRSTNLTGAGSMTWALKVTIYCLFKNRG